MKERCVKQLKKLTGKQHIFFTDRGNTAIDLCLKLAKSLGKDKIIIQDQGGWITYPELVNKNGLQLEWLATDYGIINIEDTKKIKPNEALLLNSMPGYFAVQDDVDKISKNCFVINDVSGSVGTVEAKYGVLILGSFGRWKPINLEYGGFIAFDPDYNTFFKSHFRNQLKNFYGKLLPKLESLDTRLKNINKVVQKVKKQLQQYEIIHKDMLGLNVVVKTLNEQHRLEIMDFCRLHEYEFTICPRYIRVLENAISIEIKRL